jgi:hypothetical protein
MWSNKVNREPCEGAASEIGNHVKDQQVCSSHTKSNNVEQQKQVRSQVKEQQLGAITKEYPCWGATTHTHMNKPKATKKKKQLTNYKLKLKPLQNEEKSNITQLNFLKKIFNKRRKKSA